MKFELFTDDKLESALLDKIGTVVKNVMLEYMPRDKVQKAYLNQTECATYLGVSAATLHKFILKGLKTTMIDGVTRIKITDADEFMKEHQVG